MNKRLTDYRLEFLLAFDGRIHHLEKGYWLKFEIARVAATATPPHGLPTHSRCTRRTARACGL